MGEGVEERGQRRGCKEKSRGGGGRWKAGEVEGKDGAEGDGRGRKRGLGRKERGRDGEERMGRR